MEKLLYSRKESAQALGVSLRTVDTLIALRELHVRRVRGRVLISSQELRRFAEGKTAGAEAP